MKEVIGKVKEQGSQAAQSAWQKILSYKKTAIAVVAIAVIIAVVAGGKSQQGADAIVTAETRDITDQVVVSGRTQSASQVELGFADQGRVNRVSVKEGDKVSEGQLLASIETSDLYANDVNNITREQDALVANAYRNLMSFGLEAVPEDINITMPAPVISGVYTGGEGAYKIRVYASNSVSGASFDVSGLESGFNQPVTPNTAVPLGSKGLYIRFPELTTYTPSTWTVSIPNTRATTYATYLNAYESAKASRARIVADAQASAASVASRVAKRKIYAPFSGTVAKVGIKVGEAAGGGSLTSSGEVARQTITLISEKEYEVVVKVPEISIAKLRTGMDVALTLDAYGKNEVFPGVIASINPSETIVDGVPVYETKIVFSKKDDRIRSGMTATAKIVAQEKKGVVAIPMSLIQSDDAGNFVYVVTGENTTERRAVTTGLRGSDSMVEIVTGLEAGERISPEALK